MVSRANIEGRGGYIKTAQKEASSNKPTLPARMPAGHAGLVGNIGRRAQAVMPTQQEQPTPATRQARPLSAALTGFLDRASDAGQGAGTTALPKAKLGKSQQYVPPTVEEPAPQLRSTQQEPNLGGSQSRNGVSEPTLNRSRASRSRRIR